MKHFKTAQHLAYTLNHLEDFNAFFEKDDAISMMKEQICWSALSCSKEQKTWDKLLDGLNKGVEEWTKEPSGKYLSIS